MPLADLSRVSMMMAVRVAGHFLLVAVNAQGLVAISAPLYASGYCYTRLVFSSWTQPAANMSCEYY